LAPAAEAEPVPMSVTKSYAVLALTALLSAGAAPAHPIATPAPEPSSPAVADAVTHHSLSVGSRTLDYTARVGTIQLLDGKEQPIGDMSYVAYTLDGATPAARPITFFYNGGPGSSTMWLHMGSFAPVRVVTANGQTNGPPPYRIVSNGSTLLDRSDLVFIDMPATGFGRIYGQGKPSDFFGIDKDVDAFAQFIERYISTFGRWNSPKFLYGESYGTTRSAALADQLEEGGIALNGVVLQSSILNFGLSRGSPIGGPDNGFVLDLPTEAATAWYHHALPDAPASLDALLPQVQQFALGEYSDALSRGSTLDAGTYNDVVAKLHRYTGLSDAYIRNSNLRIPYPRFQAELLRDQSTLVGRLDSRFTMQTLDGLADRADDDPTEAAINGPFTAAVNDYLRGALGYKTSLLYRSNAYDIIQQSGGWKNEHDGNAVIDVTHELAGAMTFDPHLQIFSANGYYDFATPYFATEFTLDHLGIGPNLQRNITYGNYPTGHMIYLVPSALTQLHDDLERWYASALARPQA
jgi:carboxypeptidase C (cathepsin A)